MDSEEKVFRRLARCTHDEAGVLVGSLWKNYSKADRIKNYNDNDFMNNLLEPVGWTWEEFQNESIRLSHVYFAGNP